VASDVETYLEELQAALVSAGADPALIQDARFDAEEHLQAEMAAGGQGDAASAAPLSEDERVARFAVVVEEYGTPQEVAAAYLGVTSAQHAAETVGAVASVSTAPAEAPPAGTQPLSDASTAEALLAQAQVQTATGCPACGTATRPGQAFCGECGAQLQSVPPPPPVAPYGPGYSPAQPLPTGVQYGMQAAQPSGPGQPSVWRQIFAPFAEGRVWTSLVYMILSLATGIAYFTIVVTGLSTAGGMMVLIVGIPLFMLVLAIVRGLSLFEGRLVEALLGTRMPRRLRPTPPNFGFWQRMLFWLKDGRTWASMAYMLLMLPIGIVYFTIAVTGLAVGLSLATTPIWGWFAWGFGDHTAVINGVTYNVFPLWAIPIAFVLGVLVLIGFMHLVKWIGRGHAAFAKAMLVRLK
jgi:Putative sensor